jgi:hypothetical protein
MQSRTDLGKKIHNIQVLTTSSLSNCFFVSVFVQLTYSDFDTRPNLKGIPLTKRSADDLMPFHTRLALTHFQEGQLIMESLE